METVASAGRFSSLRRLVVRRHVEPIKLPDDIVLSEVAERVASALHSSPPPEMHTKCETYRAWAQASAWSRFSEELCTLVDCEPNNLELLKSLAIVLGRLGRRADMARVAWSASRLDPRDLEARRWQESLFHKIDKTSPDDHPESASLAVVCVGHGVEIGCGHRKTHPDAIGVDLLAKNEIGAAGVVHGRASQADVCASGDNLPMFRDGQFDYVVSRHTLEHFQDPLKALEEWRRLLKPGGLLGLVLPDDTRCDTIHLDPTHKHVFTPDSFARLIKYFGGLDLVHIGECLRDWSFVAVLQSPNGTGERFNYQAALQRAAASHCRRQGRVWYEQSEVLLGDECMKEAARLNG